MYKFESQNLSQEETKSLRRKLRNERNILIENTILNFQKENIENVKRTVESLRNAYHKTEADYADIINRLKNLE